MRALWFQHRMFGPGAGREAVRGTRRMTPGSIPLQVEWGRRLPGSRTGKILPAGRAVRVRVAYGGETARRSVQAKPAGDRIYAGDGELGGRWAVAERRDWA
jgi:hypothetical protein